MSSLRRIELLLMVLILSVFSFNTGAGIFEGKRVFVEIFNDLGEGEDLTVHCKSGDKDLGVQFIKYPNGFYQFNFRTDFWGSTLFFCGFRWPSSGSALHWFDIFVYKRDHDQCSNCFWKIKPDGACKLNYDTKQYDLCYPWNSS